MLVLDGWFLVFICRDAAILRAPPLLFLPPLLGLGGWQGVTDTPAPRRDFLRPRGSSNSQEWSGGLLGRLSLADPVTFRAWLTVPGDLPGPWPAGPLTPLPCGLLPDCVWALAAVLLGSAGVFWGLSVALPLGLFELQVCLLVLITFWTFFLWAGVCLLVDLVVAGMAEGVEGRISGSQHGSKVNAYLSLSTQFVFFFKSSSFPGSLLTCELWCCGYHVIAVHDL